MHHWLLILMLAFVPAQRIWAAAAPYCGHENEASATQHVGHHEHRHQAESTAAADADTDLAGTAAHADCQVCHLGASALVPMALRVTAEPPLWPPPHAADSRYLSHVPSGPERPDWSASAAAVRFGGGGASGPDRLS